MWQQIMAKWSFMRIIRFLLGIFISIQALELHSYWMVLPGIFFSGMALFNRECCGNSCSIPSKNKKV